MSENATPELARQRRTQKEGSGAGKAAAAAAGPLGGIFQLLSDNFGKLPRTVRTVMYVAFFVLFAYLLLLPRFISGQLVTTDSEGGLLPYRGATLQILVEGHPFKYKSNEDGFFSLPLISGWPEPLEVQVWIEDRARWYRVNFSPVDVWWTRNHRIEVRDKAPYVKLAQVDPASVSAELFAQLLSALVPAANAQPVVDAATIRSGVAGAYSRISGRAASPGESLAALSYVQRIQLITTVERDFGLRIGDETWQKMSTVGQLADYIVRAKGLT